MAKKIFAALLLFMIIGLIFCIFYLPNSSLKNTSWTNIQNDKKYAMIFTTNIHPSLKETEFSISKPNSLEIPNSTDLILEYLPSLKSKLIDSLLDLGCKIKRDYEIVNQMAVFLPFENLSLLIDLPGSVKMWKDRIFQAYLDTSVPIIKPPSQWNDTEDYFGGDINGSNVKVAIIDTGLDVNHWDLRDRIIMNQSYLGGSYVDDNGHGTHIAGIIGGSGNRSSGLYTGMAPEVLFLNFKALNQFAQGSESDVIAAIYDAIGNNSDIINLSLGTEESGDGTDPYSQAVEYAESQNITCVIASGGNTGWYNVSQPGVSKSGICVGATTDSDTLYGTQPYGPTLDFRLKPDILCPGQNIISTRAAGLSFGFIIDPFYTRVSGSSMAAAHVTGLVACIKQVHPTWTPQQIKNALMNNAKNLGLDVYQQGAGRVRGPETVNATMLCNGNLDFGFVGSNKSKTLNLTIINLENNLKNLTMIHSNPDFKVNSSVILPPLSTIDIPVNLIRNNSFVYHCYDFLNISANNSLTIQSVLTSFWPNTTMNIPLEVKKNEVFNIWGNLIIDDVIPFNYSTYEIEFYANSSLEATYNLNNSPYGHYNITYSLSKVATHNLTIRFLDPQDNEIHSITYIREIRADPRPIDPLPLLPPLLLRDKADYTLIIIIVVIGIISVCGIIISRYHIRSVGRGFEEMEEELLIEEVQDILNSGGMLETFVRKELNDRNLNNLSLRELEQLNEAIEEKSKEIEIQREKNTLIEELIRFRTQFPSLTRDIGTKAFLGTLSIEKLQNRLITVEKKVKNLQTKSEKGSLNESIEKLRDDFPYLKEIKIKDDLNLEELKKLYSELRFKSNLIEDIKKIFNSLPKDVKKDKRKDLKQLATKTREELFKVRALDCLLNANFLKDKERYEDIVKFEKQLTVRRIATFPEKIRKSFLKIVSESKEIIIDER